MSGMDALLSEFDTWAADRWGRDDGDRRSDAQLLLDWQENYSGAQLERLTTDDLDEFLLGWVPRKVSAPPEFAQPLCQSISQFMEFLASTGRLSAGQGARLVVHAVSCVPDIRKEGMGLDDEPIGPPPGHAVSPL